MCCAGAEATGVETAGLDLPAGFLLLLSAAVATSALGATANAALVGLDRSRSVLRAGAAGTAVAIAGSLTLVQGAGPLPQLGITGTGWAMLAGALVTAAVAWSALGRPGRSARPAAVARLARIGVPLGATVLVKFAVLGVVSLAAAREGVLPAAAHSIAIVLANLVFTAGVAVGQATVPPVARHAREGDWGAVRTSVRAGAGVAAAAVVAAAVVLAPLHGSVVGIFTPDTDVAAVVSTLLPLVLLVVAADAVQAVVGFGLVGLQRTLPSFVAFAVLYGTLAAAALPAAAAGGLEGLWAAIAASNLALVAAQTVLFLRRSHSTSRQRALAS